MFLGRHVLDSSCQQQHMVALSSAEAELHEIVNGSAQGLFVRNVHGSGGHSEGVGTGSSAASGITYRLRAGRVRNLEAEDLWVQEKVRCHEFKVTKRKSDTRQTC